MSYKVYHYILLMVGDLNGFPDISPIMKFLIRFFMSYLQSFSYIGTGLPGLNQF